MNTITTIINSMSQQINEDAIDTLVTFGISHNDAVKTVIESDFDLIQSVESNPVELLELEF
jgi:hypothetical protein